MCCVKTSNLEIQVNVVVWQMTLKDATKVRAARAARVAWLVFLRSTNHIVFRCHPSLNSLLFTFGLRVLFLIGDDQYRNLYFADLTGSWFVLLRNSMVPIGWKLWSHMWRFVYSIVVIWYIWRCFRFKECNLKSCLSRGLIQGSWSSGLEIKNLEVALYQVYGRNDNRRTEKVCHKF